MFGFLAFVVGKTLDITSSMLGQESLNVYDQTLIVVWRMDVNANIMFNYVTNSLGNGAISNYANIT